MRREDHVMGVTLLSLNMIFLIRILLIQLSCLDGIEATSGARKCGNRRSEVTIAAARLAHFVSGLLALFIQAKLVFGRP